MFSARVQDSRLNLGTDYQRDKFHAWLRGNEGARVTIAPVLPESRKQRRWFEGAVVPLLAFYAEGMDHRNYDDLRKVREWLKLEFNGEFVTLDGISHKVAASTKGQLNRGFLEAVLGWVNEQYDPPYQALDPAQYKLWRDTVFPYGGPDNYIDYLCETGVLRR